MQLVSIAGVTLGSAITIETTGMSQDIPGAGATLDYRDVWRERSIAWTLLIRNTTRDAVMSDLDTLMRAIYVAQHGRNAGDDGSCLVEMASQHGTVRTWLRDVTLKLVSVEQESRGMVARVALTGTQTSPAFSMSFATTSISASSFVPSTQTINSIATLQLLQLRIDTSPSGLTDALHVIESLDTTGSTVMTVTINPATPPPTNFTAETFSTSRTRLRATASGSNATITYNVGSIPQLTLYHIWLCISVTQSTSVLITSNAASFAPQRIVVHPAQTWYRVGVWDYHNYSGTRTITITITNYTSNTYVYPLLLIPATAHTLYIKTSQYQYLYMQPIEVLFVEVRSTNQAEIYGSFPIITSNVIAYTHAFHLPTLSAITTTIRAHSIMLSASL